MGELPTVTIVGRPNVGKSTLFNTLIGRRIAIVEARSGVTRDRVSAQLSLGKLQIELIDTGGIGTPDREELVSQIEAQIDSALTQADLLIFVVDCCAGRTPFDAEVATKLRQTGKEILLVANKADNEKLTKDAVEFYKLGLGEPVPVSAKNRMGIERLKELFIKHLIGISEAHIPETALSIAIVGKRNVGKSLFVNCLAGHTRMVVSPVPGTTRDSVDVRFEKDGLSFVAIDTAGIRKRTKIADSVEFYSFARTQRSIRRADVVLFLVDVMRKVTATDKKIGNYIMSQFKPCVVVANKWDTAVGFEPQDYADYFHKIMPGLSFAPISFASALTGLNVMQTITVAQQLQKQALRRVTTSMLNRVLRAVIGKRYPSSKRAGKKFPKVYYATQVAVTPPEIVLFVNDASLFSESYLRFLENSLRCELPFVEIPIRLKLKAHSRKER